MEKTGKDKSDKEKKIEAKLEKAFAKKQEAFRKGSSEPADLLSLLLDDLPFKSTNKSMKMETFAMVFKTFKKIKVGDLTQLTETLGEDKSIDLLKYCFKAFELVHRQDQDVIEMISFPLCLNYLNVTSEQFGSIGIARTGFERGDLYD
ncbi:unnamed protein product [Moneuplotes crassus]|uniref:Uncharacterized protein n=1 Tax=Euplotes crassus TaxID=5936 RepID=A0AAD2D801_EUPCR|nr:unnamed protein product [Moneuplotes crassus]